MAVQPAPREGERARGFFAQLRRDLIAHAEHKFRLDRRDKDGNSEREHLEGLLERARSRGDDERAKALQEELTGPPLPVLAKHLMRWFGELQRERGYAGMGDPLPLTSKDIRGWMDLRHRRPNYQEIEILLDLDTVWLNVRAEGQKQ